MSRRLGVAGAVIEGHYVAGDVTVVDGRVAGCGQLPAGRGLALPGLVDLQVNGYGGVDFLTASADEYRVALAALRADGIFGVQPTLITAAEEELHSATAAAAAAIARFGTAYGMLGVHLEGPFLSAHHRGIHRVAHLRRPDAAMLDRLRAAGPVRTVTIAPELDGGLDLVGHAAARGIIVQLGHTGASADVANAAFDRGARTVTHLFNCMRPFAHRDPGVVGTTLARRDVTVQIIADGVHVADDALRAVLNAAADRTILVTDAISPAAAPDGHYTAGGLDLVISDGVPRLADGTLAGNVQPLLDQVRRVAGFGWPIDAAVNMASRRPALLHGRDDLGVLRVGGVANLLVVDEALELRHVLTAGVAAD